MWKKLANAVTMVTLLLGMVSASRAQGASSPGFQLTSQTLSSGGGRMDAPRFSLVSALLPQPVTAGAASSASFRIMVGFIPASGIHGGIEVVGGGTTGVSPTRVLCTNRTTGQTVTITDGTPSWDCAAAGLVVQPGDVIWMQLRGVAN